jgi:membrane-associated HD superfamily phosphohydrolase
MDLKNQILVALGLDKAEEVSLAWQSKLEDGTIVVSTAETLEAGVDASVLTEDGTTIPLPIGTYKTEDGLSFRIEAEGVVAEVMESETEEKDTTEEEDLAVEDKKEDDYADVGDWEGMEKRIQNLEDAVADLKRSKEGGDDDVEEMAEEVVEPSVNPKSIKTTEVKEFSIEELKAENEKLKTELAEAPAEAPLNTNKFSSERPTPTKQDFRRMTKQEKFLYELYK